MPLPRLENLKDGRCKIIIGNKEQICKNRKQAKKKAGEHLKFIKENNCKMIIQPWYEYEEER